MWDVGGQKSLRSYWRNYFECTDGLIWVVDSADKRRVEDCRDELHTLLREERLAGCTLLVFANKQDLPGALSSKEIKDVSINLNFLNLLIVLHYITYKSVAWNDFLIKGCNENKYKGQNEFSLILKLYLNLSKLFPKTHFVLAILCLDAMNVEG